ncbi:shikimate kinase [Sphingobacterium shayense]|uniref:shikimate kinase n=1 Tax=Sphingobacterium shayense TaxID=626343 RepID=UPI001556914A|nr:shikimate kinase [Sphingobacterium shayense]NQD71207.1 shikimate kinase [Sphingobacterium shayense]
MDKPIFLIGFMGSGKTTLGKKLAKQLNKQFIDLDEKIVQYIGMSIPEYFNQHGESEFRKLESKLLKEQTDKNTVISTGGGSPCYFDNMEWIRNNGISLYLQLTPKALYSRLQQSNIGSRPALGGLQGDALLEFIESKLQERAPYYLQAHIHIDQISTPLEIICQSIESYEQNV